MGRLRALKITGKGETTISLHASCGTPSHSAKSDVKADFLKFLDFNRAPHGRRLGSPSAQYYLDAKFTSIRMPDKKDPNYEDKMACSLVGVFNESQAIEGRGRCGNTAAREWLNKERPDTAISPLKSDYFDTCKEYYTENKRQQQAANQLRESGNAEQAEVAAHDSCEELSVAVDGAQRDGAGQYR